MERTNHYNVVNKFAYVYMCVVCVCVCVCVVSILLCDVSEKGQCGPIPHHNEDGMNIDIDVSALCRCLFNVCVSMLGVNAYIDCVLKIAYSNNILFLPPQLDEKRTGTGPARYDRQQMQQPRIHSISIREHPAARAAVLLQ